MFKDENNNGQIKMYSSIPINSVANVAGPKTTSNVILPPRFSPFPSHQYQSSDSYCWDRVFYSVSLQRCIVLFVVTWLFLIFWTSRQVMGTSLNNLYSENNSKELQKAKKFFTVSTVISVATVCYANQASASARTVLLYVGKPEEICCTGQAK
jgi:hypothetical protein